MLSQLNLKRFKCFREQRIPLSELTLLTGLNSGGKSTVIQALAALNQSVQFHENSEALLLDGPKVSLGTARDVINQATGGNEFEIGIRWIDTEVQWLFRAIDRSALSVPVVDLKLRVNGRRHEAVDLHDSVLYNLLPEDWNTSSLHQCLETISYIGAERCGPRETYPDSVATQRRDVGARGERAPAILRAYEDSPVLDGVQIPGVAPLLLQQAEAWMQKFFPNIRIEVLPVERANLVTLGLRTAESADMQRPQNVGYGITHILPLVTACLIAHPGELVLIENPEVHLHPAAQSKMGEFLGQTAGCGVQLIVETHSDHILNGVRRSIKNRLIKSENVLVNYFSLPSDEVSAPAQVTTITFAEDGKLDSWPAGFFDQIDQDLAFLSGWA